MDWLVEKLTNDPELSDTTTEGWYANACKAVEVSQPVPDDPTFNYCFDVIDAWAERDPERLALWSICDDDLADDARITYQELREQSCQFANVLRRLGVKRGTRMIVMLPRMPEWYYAVLGAIRLGVVSMPTTAMSTSKDIHYRINQATPIVAITTAQYIKVIDGAEALLEDKKLSIKYKIAVDSSFFFKPTEEDPPLPPGWLSFSDLMEGASCELSKEEALDWPWEGTPSKNASRASSRNSSRSNSPVRPSSSSHSSDNSPNSSSSSSSSSGLSIDHQHHHHPHSHSHLYPADRDVMMVKKMSSGVHICEQEDIDNDREKVKVSLQDPILLYFTSGTTGNPKMVRHCGTYPMAFVPIARWTMQLQEGDVIWSMSDTGWAKTAYGKLFGQWALGCVVVQFQQDRFDPHKVLKLIEQCSVTVLCLPPTAYRMLINATDFAQPGAYDLSTLRHCVSSGEPLNPKVIQVWKEITSLDIYDFYGQTETTVLASNFPGLPIRQGSMGLPFPGLDLCLLDDDGNRITEPNQEGSIALYFGDRRPPGLLLDFWRAEEANSERFSNGFYHTGDRAYRDPDGYLWYVGRSDDVFKASGYRIGPFEVESALMQHESVIEAAVIGAPDETRGLIVKAFVVLRPGWQRSQSLTLKLQEHVKSVTAPYKYPRVIEYVSSLPKTISGKIKRNVLRVQEFQKAFQKSQSQSLLLPDAADHPLVAEVIVPPPDSRDFDALQGKFFTAISAFSSSEDFEKLLQDHNAHQ